MCRTLRALATPALTCVEEEEAVVRDAPHDVGDLVHVRVQEKLRPTRRDSCQDIAHRVEAYVSTRSRQRSRSIRLTGPSRPDGAGSSQNAVSSASRSGTIELDPERFRDVDLERSDVGVHLRGGTHADHDCGDGWLA